MKSSAEPFSQAEQQWNLERLYRDLAKAKHQYCDKVKPLTLLEMACLRGLLCGCSPPEIAAELNREPRGLRVDLSRGLYRYVEVLTGRNPNELKDWRDVAAWLNSYQKSVNSASDSAIKIVDIAISGTRGKPVLDVKVRNVGQQVAFLKRVEFKLYKNWTLYSWVPESIEPRFSPSAPSLPERAIQPIARSRMVEPSYDYEVNLEEMELEVLNLQSQLNSIASNPLNSTCLITESLSLSQCVAHNDVDRFTISLKFSPSIPQRCDFGFTTHVYHFRLDLIYDEDDKVAKSQSLLLAIESENLPPLHYRTFFYTPDQIDFHDLNRYSVQNQSIFAEIVAISGLHNVTLKEICRYFTRPQFG